MSARPRMTLTREGRYYLFVLAFIVGGAVLREVNLLVVLAALMVGPILFSWRAVVMTMRRLSVRRRMVSRISMGDSLVVAIELKNHRRSLASWAFTVTDHVHEITRVGDETQGSAAESETKVDIFFPMVPAGAECVVEYRLTLSRRGRYQFGPLKLSTGFPFDFMRGTVEADCPPAEVLVCPAVGRLTTQWQRQIESLQHGQQRAQRRRGLAEGDYYGLREWRPGDSRRWIHWRTSAKLGAVSVLQFEELRHRDLALIIDLWQPDAPTDEDRAYVEFAVSFAATTAVESGKRGGSELAMAVAGREVGCWVATASRILAQEILDHLATVRAAAQVDLAAALRALTPKLRRGAKLIVISTRSSQGARTTAATDANFRESLDAVAEWYDVRDEHVREFLQFEATRTTA